MIAYFWFHIISWADIKKDIYILKAHPLEFGYRGSLCLYKWARLHEWWNCKIVERKETGNRRIKIILHLYRTTPFPWEGKLHTRSVKSPCSASISLALPLSLALYVSLCHSVFLCHANSLSYSVTLFHYVFLCLSTHSCPLCHFVYLCNFVSLCRSVSLCHFMALCLYITLSF